MMSTASHLPEFMEYLGSRQDMKPDKTFDARAAEAAVLPTGISSFPLGDVFLYPEFLAFLTTRKFSGGAAGYREDVVHRLTEFGKGTFMVHKWFIHPASTISDLAKYFNNKYQSKQVITDALTNQHSFFVPLSKIKAVNTGGGWPHPPTITITTDETTYLLYQNTDISFWNITNFKRNCLGLLE